MDLLTQSALADLLSVSERTLEGWRRTGEGPGFKRLGGRCVRYQLSEVERWLASSSRSSTSDTGGRR
jgi:predicted DNA-binding transcriptional regulator AlpA